MPTPFSHWRKSSRSSGNNGNCVEVGFSPDAAQAGIRDTKDRTYGTLAVPAAHWAAFVDTVKAGRLDLN